MCAPAPWMRSFRWFGQVVDRAARPRAVCCESKNVQSDVAKRCHPRFRRARREMCWGSAIQALRRCISMSRILDIPTSSSCARCRRCGALPVAQYPSNGRLARPRIRPNLWNAARSQAVRGGKSSAGESAQTVRQRAGHKLSSPQWPTGLPATRPNIYCDGRTSIGICTHGRICDQGVAGYTSWGRSCSSLTMTRMCAWS
jgi:hypothetical protein